MKFKLLTMATYYSKESAEKYERYGFQFFPQKAGRNVVQITDFEPTVDLQMGDLYIMQKNLGDLIIGDG